VGVRDINPLISAGIKVLEMLFFAGILGSAVVIILTAVEDARTMLSRDNQQASRNDEWPRQL
jgi:hypothetical protein